MKNARITWFSVAIRQMCPHERCENRNTKKQTSFTPDLRLIARQERLRAMILARWPERRDCKMAKTVWHHVESAQFCLGARMHVPQRRSVEKESIVRSHCSTVIVTAHRLRSRRVTRRLWHPSTVRQRPQVTRRWANVGKLDRRVDRVLRNSDLTRSF